MKCTLLLVLNLALLLKLVRGDPLDQFVRHYEQVNVVPRVTTAEKTLTAKINFRAYGREFKVHLATHSGLFEKGFHVEVVGKNGGTVKKDIDTRGYVTGYVLGETGSTVHGRLKGESLDIVINSQRETYHLEPASKYGLQGDFNSVIYRTSDVVYKLKHDHCSSADLPRLRLAQETAKPTDNTLSNEFMLRRKRAVDPDRNTCNVKIVADFEFYRGVGNSLESTTLEIMVDHIMTADNIYRSTVFEGRNGQYSQFGLSVDSAQIYTDENLATNPLVGDFSPDELLEAFAEFDFDGVCLGHLFTYRDYSGVVGLAYLADPNGQIAGGICQQRTRTSMGVLNLNTGFTSLLNFGSQIPRAVSYITTAHELGHNHGSPHDPPGLPCTPEGSQPKYIMFPSATTGGLREFSSCSKEFIGQTLESRSASCFIARPTGAQCGNGIVEPGEACDCGSSNETECAMNDPCCTVNCTLAVGAECSAGASACCNGSTCQPVRAGIVCLTGDTRQGGCQEDSMCNGTSPNCPSSTPAEDGTPCNDRENVCEDGSCIGSPCILFNNSKPCYCKREEELCDVCCLFDGDDGECQSTLVVDGVPDLRAKVGYPCANFTGFCDNELTCLRINNNDPLNRLRDILLDPTSIVKWLEANWHWVLVGFVCLIILIVLIQVTYRRKKIKTEVNPDSDSNNQSSSGQTRARGRQREAETYGYFQTRPRDEEAETSTLLY